MKSTLKSIVEWTLYSIVVAGVVYGAWLWLSNTLRKPELDLALINYVDHTPEGCAWKAVATCDYEILMECLTEKDLTSTDDKGRTLLDYVVTIPAWQESETACLASAVYLNIKGVSVGSKDNDGLTSLHYASMAGNPLAVIYLYNKDNSLIDEKDDLGFTPLNYAETYAELGGERYTSVINYLKGMKKLGVLLPVMVYAKIAWVEGMVYADMGEFDSAISRLTASIDACTHETSCLVNIGWRAYWIRGAVYDKQEQYDKAIADFSSAIELHPEEIYLLYNRGQAYYSLGQCDAAKADLEQYTLAVFSHMEVGEIISGESVVAYASAEDMISSCIDVPR